MKIAITYNYDNFCIDNAIEIPDNAELSLDYFFDDEETQLQHKLEYLDTDTYDNEQLYYDCDRDSIVSESEIYPNYKELFESGEYEGSFDNYLDDCCRSGCLDIIKKL